MVNGSGRVGFGSGRAGSGQFDQINFRVTGRVGSERVGFRVDSDRSLSGYGSGRVRTGRVSGRQYSLFIGSRVGSGQDGSRRVAFYRVFLCTIVQLFRVRVVSSRVGLGFGLLNCYSNRVSG